ncbi:MAG: LysM peptidoglycan-binding domain-containing protein [Chloroflexi bacterium]|nr:MAG: LysM peptidoglycan-binding domain-containing protein [Chloroflexota bacterium]
MTQAQKLILHPRIILTVVILIFIVPALTPVPTAAQAGQTHTVQTGENLFRIALRYGLTVETLASANGITDPAHIYAGQVLVIPDGSAPVLAAADPAVVDPASVVAVDPAVTGPDLGILPIVDSPSVVPSAAPVYHTVQRGETLASIGQAYGVTWADIAAANGISNANQIYAGQQLTVPGASAPGAAAVAPPVAPAIVEPAPVVTTTQQTAHVVQQGEHLSAIARAYGVSWPSIAAVNSITDPNQIYAGQTLVIPAADTGQGVYIQPDAWTPPAAPAPTIVSGKQIVVDLGDQRVYAYENGALIRNVLVSTGLWGTPTVLGDYRIYVKYDSQLMSGPGYYLPGVPWVMYFYQGYSLHGTYWHSNFGQPMSHGCVNMPTPEAEWFYTWAPIGTPVHVQS